MAFHNVSLPSDFQYASQFGAGFETVIQETASAHEYRIARQAQPRHRFRLRKALQSPTEMAALKTFAMGRRGSLHGFRIKDWSDYSSASDGKSTPTNLDCTLGTGDGSETQFQLSKTYDVSGASPLVRSITLPVASSTAVAVAGSSKTEGLNYTVTDPGGVITFMVAPIGGQVVTAGFQFDVPARFEASTDQWQQLRVDANDVWSLADLECIEVLNEVESPELWYPGGVQPWGSMSADFSMSFAQGELHTVSPTAALNAFLPAPPTLFPGGGRIFVVSVTTGAAGSIQLRDDAGNAVGSAMSGGTVSKVVALEIASGTATWVLR